MSRRTILVLSLLAATLGAGTYLFHRGWGPKFALPSGPSPDLFSLIPQNAPAVGYIDLAALRASPFGAEMARLAPAPSEDPDYREFVRSTGFDYSRDLDRLAFAAWPSPSRPGNGPTPILVLAEGRFDESKIAAYAARSSTMIRKGKAEIYQVRENDRGRPLFLVFLTPGRIALASGASLDPVLHPAARSPREPAQPRDIERVAGAAFFMVARTQDFAKDLANVTAHSEQLRRLLETLQTISLAGQPRGDRLELAVDGDCDSTTHAFQLATALEGMRWLGRAALADPRTRQQFTPQDAALLNALLQGAQISHQGPHVRLRVELSGKTLVGKGPSKAIRQKG